MRNILIAIAAGIAAHLVLYLPSVLRLGEAMLPAVIVFIAVYFVVARRTFKQVERIFNEAASCLTSMPPKIDLAITTLHGAYAYAPVQIGVRTQVDNQIGVLHFLQQNFNEALPFLQRSLGFGHWLGAAMLAVVHYKKKNHDEMRRVLEIVTKKGSKQGLAWCLRAYLLAQTGDEAGAQAILAQGVKATKNDERVAENLLNVQNGKKIKMKGFKEQWYQFHLERPPAEFARQAGFQPKLSRAMRRGRW